MARAIHDITQNKYRNPLGALGTGSKLTLRLYAEALDISDAKVTVYNKTRSWDYEMNKIANENAWEVTFAVADKADVFWYYFTLNSNEGFFYYTCDREHRCPEGFLSREFVGGFQLTVFDKEYKTPDWFKKAVMYQIFPDRFVRGNKENLKIGQKFHESKGRKVIVHKDWNERPYFMAQEDEPYYNPYDFFGGDLAGIESMLPCFKEMGISCLYLNPVFESASNHRYNTGDYFNIDPFLGTKEEFEELVKKAKEMGISIMLDGVFSHTGADSVYFNKEHRYEEEGAFESEESKYRSWYQFFENGKYKSWWGFESLPEVNEMDETWQDMVITGEDSVFKHWLGRGICGFRLDVADELPDEVIEIMRTEVKKASEERVLLGEVWEDATTKESYGINRTYALGKGLDSVMNYPFRDNVIAYLNCETDAFAMANFLGMQCVNYPIEMYYALMNLLSSHDVSRIRTVLGAKTEGKDMDRNVQAAYVLTYPKAAEGKSLMKLAYMIAYLIPGVPCVYYGDEYGMEGFRDPFNREPYYERSVDKDIKELLIKLGGIRNERDVLSTGNASFAALDSEVLGILRFIREDKNADRFGNEAKSGLVVGLINRNKEDRQVTVKFSDFTRCLSENDISYLSDINIGRYKNLLSGEEASFANGEITLTLKGYKGAILEIS